MRDISNFFKDKNGRIVIAQMPNVPLFAWFIFTMLDFFWINSQPRLHQLFQDLSFGFIFTWSWLELTTGINPFRKCLGLLVLIGVIFLR